MSLKLKYTDEHGILHINMSPTSSAKNEENREPEPPDSKIEITDPKFDTINNRFSQYDLFGVKYDVEAGGDPPPSLFRSRYNSIEEELANTPYAFATERSLRLNNANPLVDITIKSRAVADDASPSQDIEDDRFFNRNLSVEYDDGLFGPQFDFQTKSSLKTSDEDSPAFTVTQLIHAQDRYFDLSSRQSSSVVDSPKLGSIKSVPTKQRVKTISDSIAVRSAPNSAKKERTVTIVERGKSDDAFKVLSSDTAVKAVRSVEHIAKTIPVVPTPKRKKESSFAIIAETPTASRPSSPRSLPTESRSGRVSPFKGRGFREETSRHNTPKTSAANSRASSPPRRRTRSLTRIDRMAQAATLPPPVHTLTRPHSPRNFVKENIEEVRGLSELNREKHEAEAEQYRKEEEEALLREMGLASKNAKSDAVRSISGSRSTSRSNSPNKIKLRSRSNSPSAILHYENIPTDSKEIINAEDRMAKPVTHKSRHRSVTRSEPQSNNGSPKNSKIPKRQSSVSPARTVNRRDISNSRKPLENNLNRNQKFMSNSTSSIHETIKVGSSIHDKRGVSKSTQHLNISPAHIIGKPPISPGGRIGPPPSNKSINPKRLSPIVGTPNKSPVEDLKPSSAKTPTKTSPAAKKPVKTVGNTPATSRLNSRQPSRTVTRDSSPDKRKNATTRTSSSSSKPVTKPAQTKPVNRTPSTTRNPKPSAPNKVEPKKPMNRTSSMKSLTRTPSTKTLNEKPPLLKRDSRKDIKALSTSKLNEVGAKKDPLKKDTKTQKVLEKGKDKDKDTSKKENKTDVKKEETKGEVTKADEDTTNGDLSPTKQDNETQYDKIVNEKGELVILTKKNVVSMTTAAITAQPLEVVTTVTNQLPSALEKAREKGMFERLSSRESLAPKDEDKENKPEEKLTKEKEEKLTEKSNEKTEKPADKEKHNEHKVAKPMKNNNEKALYTDDNIKLRPLQPPYNAEVERVKQKIDNILKEPEVSTENILAAATVVKEPKHRFKNVADKTKNDIRDAKIEVANKLTNIKDQVMKKNEKMASDIRSEASKIVDSIITPVEEPKDAHTNVTEDIKKNIEPIVMVVNEKTKNGPNKSEIIEKITETLVKGEADIEVQSSNLSTPGIDKMTVQNKMADGDDSNKSAQSNGGFPQSTSTTPKPPPRAKTNQTDIQESSKEIKENSPESEKPDKKPNICQRFIGKCKTKCCPCCIKSENDENEMKDDKDKKENKQKKEIEHDVEAPVEKKQGLVSKFGCCKKTEKDVEEKISDVEKAAQKQAATIEFENETKRKRKFRDVLCCGRRRRVSDVSDAVFPRSVGDVTTPAVATDADVTADTGCCGKKKREVERRDSILSDEPPSTCCNNRLFNWLSGPCRRQSEPASSSRRTSMFSKNKSLSPTLPPEDKRPKLDASLVEHTSVMRGAIPVLPIVLAYFCLFCNIIVPGLGTILSGMFCLCFGIPRFGVHDGAKHRIGSFVINLLVGCGQLFTVMFCLVGWGWSIWWGVIMLKISRKYRKMKAEEAAEEAEAAPPVTANNHTRA